jgi:hypothetical protein
MKENKTMRGWEASNLRRKDKQSESNIVLMAKRQILKQQKQLNGRNCHTSVNINTKYQQTQFAHQKTLFRKLD